MVVDIRCKKMRRLDRNFSFYYHSDNSYTVAQQWVAINKPNSYLLLTKGLTIEMLSLSLRTVPRSVYTMLPMQIIYSRKQCFKSSCVNLFCLRDTREFKPVFLRTFDFPEERKVACSITDFFFRQNLLNIYCFCVLARCLIEEIHEDVS